MELFDHRDEELTEDNFVHYHVEYLKLENYLSIEYFDKKDLPFIEKYERRRAKNYFNERNQYLKGYENDRISVNKTIQQLGYQQLKHSFFTDPFIRTYLRK